MKPRILLTGRYGQVGCELERMLPQVGEVFAFGRDELDLANPDQIREKVRLVKPDIIVNAAAYTSVDKAEEEPELAMAINGTAPGILAKEAKKLNALLVHYSTDYVFDGTKAEPYTEEDEPNPRNVYGKTKLSGEKAIQATWEKHLIFRTSWVYGMRGKNFLLTILRLARERDEIRVVDDQFGAPTWCRTISETTAAALATLHRAFPDPEAERLLGLYHLTASGCTTWFGFARSILEHVDETERHAVKVIPIHSSDYSTPARRPLNSRLSCLKAKNLLMVQLRDWDNDLSIAMRARNE